MVVEPNPVNVRRLIQSARIAGHTIGVVPTMGALHAGHVSLLHAARAECDYVVATIFVNPTQFGPNEDFDRYPRTLDSDLAQCEDAGTDLVFTPQKSDMYQPDAQTIVRVEELTKKLEGAIRPGHFDGVTTVVAKLFNITIPDKTFFGQKDYQQQLIIRRMVRDLDWGIEVVTCPTVREPDGLAMSSRNRYLTDSQRRKSLTLWKALQLAEERATQGTAPQEIARQMSEQIEAQPGVQLDYAVVADAETLEPADKKTTNAVALVAARVGSTRLIDNHILRFR